MLDFFSFFFKGHTRNVSCDTLGLLHWCCEEQFVTQCADFGEVASGNLQIRFLLSQNIFHIFGKLRPLTLEPLTEGEGGGREGAFNAFDNDVIYDTSICLPLDFFYQFFLFIGLGRFCGCVDIARDLLASLKCCLFASLLCLFSAWGRFKYAASP